MSALKCDPITPQLEAAMKEFDQLVTAMNKLVQTDVWTGASNGLVDVSHCFVPNKSLLSYLITVILI